MPLVEVIRGEKTSDATIATAVAYAKTIGKSPIVVGDGPGFLVNRVLLPYMNEALLLLEEGASIKRSTGGYGIWHADGADHALRHGRARHCSTRRRVMQEAFPDRVVPRKICQRWSRPSGSARKNGRGFFDYGNRKKKDRGQESAEVADSETGARAEEGFRTEITDRLFLPMLLEATRLLEEGSWPTCATSTWADLRHRFPPFQGGLFFWADTLGAARS